MISPRHSQMLSYLTSLLLLLLQNTVKADQTAPLTETTNDHRALTNIFNYTKYPDGPYANVIGGTFVPIDAYPWFARATANNNQNKWGECGGSLVSPSFVLTAAHCIDSSFRNSGGYDVGSRCYGSADTNNNNCNQDGNQYRKVDWVWVDPKYNKNNDDYDFALVRLSSPVTIDPVLMNSKSAVPSGGQNVIGMGFGATDRQGNGKSLKLLQVTVDALTPSACKQKWSQNGITPQMVCAVREGKDTCSGDSGGPLITTSKPYKVVGLSSFGGNLCADLNAPGVYARVSNRYDTLVETICGNTPSSHPTASFCGGGGNPPTPVSPPASSPVKQPTTGGGSVSDCVDNGCPDSNTGKLKVKMLTDPYGDLDNFWYIKKGKKKVLNINNLSNNTEYSWCSCLPTGKYKYFIKDREGDGFVEDGFLRMWWNGKRKLSLTADSGEWTKKKKNLRQR